MTWICFSLVKLLYDDIKFSLAKVLGPDFAPKVRHKMKLMLCPLNRHDDQASEAAVACLGPETADYLLHNVSKK